MNDNQIDWRETVETLLARSKRSFVPIDKSFVQLPRGNEERNSVLARFIRNGDLRGLKAYLLIAASTSSSDENGEWYTTLPLQTGQGRSDAFSMPESIQEKLQPRRYSPACSNGN